jgi:hypothetical protein
VDDGFEELQSVAVRVLAVEAAHSREVIVIPNGRSGRTKAVGPSVKVADD